MGLFGSKKPEVLYRRSGEDFTPKRQNPGRGFYSIFPFDLTSDIDEGQLMTSLRSDQQLVLVEVDLSAYRDCGIDDFGRNRLHDILRFFVGHDKDIILRFCYDLIGHAVESEPDSLSRVIEHMDTVGRIAIKYKKNIYLVQGLFIGNWGEMHSSRYADETTIKKLYRAYRLGPMGELYLAVRTISQLRLLLGESDDLRGILEYDGMLSPEMKKAVTKVGLFDDAIMYDETDMGTYKDYERADALTYVHDACVKVPVGGEVLEPAEPYEPGEIIETMQRMRISYLNSQHDAKLLDAWRDMQYREQNLYEYIDIHMGYVLLVCELSFMKKECVFTISLKNIGFGAFVDTADLRIHIRRVVKRDDGSEERTTEQRLNMRISHGTLRPDEEFSAKLPAHDLPRGRYELEIELVRLRDGRRIEFSNTDDLSVIPFVR